MGERSMATICPKCKREVEIPERWKFCAFCGEDLRCFTINDTPIPIEEWLVKSLPDEGWLLWHRGGETERIFIHKEGTDKRIEIPINLLRKILKVGCKRIIKLNYI